MVPLVRYPHGTTVSTPRPILLPYGRVVFVTPSSSAGICFPQPPHSSEPYYSIHIPPSIQILHPIPSTPYNIYLAPGIPCPIVSHIRYELRFRSPNSVPGITYSIPHSIYRAHPIRRYGIFNPYPTPSSTQQCPIPGTPYSNHIPYAKILPGVIYKSVGVTHHWTFLPSVGFLGIVYKSVGVTHHRTFLPSVGFLGPCRVRVDGLKAGRISGERLVIPFEPGVDAGVGGGPVL